MIGHVLKSFQFYGYAVIQLLIEPRLFFTELSRQATWMKSLGFCIICSIFYVAAGLLAGSYPNPVAMGGIFLLNSMGIMLISAGLSYLVMVKTLGRICAFEMILSVHSFSTGVLLLASWMPFFLWFTEPWKWWLVYTGYKNTCGFQTKPAFLILLATMGFQIILWILFYPVLFK